MSMATGTIGIDSASRVDPVAAYKAGSRFQVRYSAAAATDPNHSSYAKNAKKLCQPGEINAIIQSGQDFMANDEWYVDRIKEGAPAAEQDAPVTLKFWRSRGLSPGATISLNLDTGYTSSMQSGIDAYFDRTNKIWGGEYVADKFYGPLACARQLARSGRIKHYWIPEGASFFSSDDKLVNAPYPANSVWDLWAPTPSQVNYAIKFLLDYIGADARFLQSIIWQDLNHMLGGAADQNIVLKGTRMGSHLDHATKPQTEDLSIVDAETKSYLDNMQSNLAHHIDVAIKENLPRAVLMVLSGQPNSMYTAADMAGDYKGFVTNSVYQQLAGQEAALTAIAEKTGLSAAEIGAIVADALAKNVVDVDINVHGTPTTTNQPGPVMQ